MIQSSRFYGYDIIGDVHGCASALRRLLHKLDYRETPHGFAYRDNSRPRQVIFVGDLIDRGHEIAETLHIAKTMWQQGNAQIVMGNHELSAIAWHTPVSQGFLRPHNERGYRQFQATLEQFADRPQQLAAYVEWFRQLPLFVELDNCRVVHACWDQQLIDDYWQRYQTSLLVDDVLLNVRQPGSFAARFLERLTHGISLPLPAGYQMHNPSGFPRHSFRVKFWSDEAETYNDILFQPAPLPPEVAAMPLSAAERSHLLAYDAAQKPLFTGHYWLKGEPRLIQHNIACLDYSAVNQGRLVAYRIHHGDTRLYNRQFVAVDCGENG